MRPSRSQNEPASPARGGTGTNGPARTHPCPITLDLVDTALDPVDQLTEPECMRLLGTVQVGRVALTSRALPVVLPVNFALDGHGIVIRTGPGSMLTASRDDVVVAFEADELDPDTCSGWSVLVTGTMREITSPSAILRAEQLRLAPWVGGGRRHYIRITPGLISGRLVGQARRVPDPSSGSAPSRIVQGRNGP